MGNKEALNLNLGAEEKRRESLEEARDRMTPTLTKPVDLVQGGKGILVYFPIFLGDRFDGFVLVVFDTQEWLDHALRNGRSLHEFEDYQIAISIDNERVFQTKGYQYHISNEWFTKADAKILGHAITVSIYPTAHFLTHEKRISAEMIGLAFAIFGFILSGLVFYLQKASTATRLAEQVNEVLANESKERLVAEKKANAANEAKTRFLAAMSHEIRTPLNGVLGVLQLLEKRDFPGDVREKLKTAQHSGVFLLTLVNQVLDFARIEAGAVEIIEEDFTVSALIADLHSLFSTQAEQKKLEFDYSVKGPSELWVFGAYDPIKQVLFNLIGNAIKFTDQGSVAVYADIQERLNGSVGLQFDVVDTGKGISDEEQKLIFDAFKQSETGRTSRMGSGLGLSISKNLTNMIEGKLEVKSKVDQGTTFTLWIDVVVAKEQKAPVQKSSEAVIASPLKILVAEDNDINQMIIEEMLTSDGHDFVLAENGEEAVEKVFQNGLSFDLILMDIQMPVMNGVEATKAIRKQIPDTEILPIYALTANAFKSQMDEYEAAGMQGTLTKPIDRPKLRSVLLKVSDQKKEKELNAVVDIPLGKQAL